MLWSIAPMCVPKGDTGVGPSPVDRDRPGSKHHLLVDAGGLPLAVRVTGSNRHDVTQLLPLVEQVPPIRGRPGRPLRRPRQLVGDRAYDSDHTATHCGHVGSGPGWPHAGCRTARGWGGRAGWWSAPLPGCTPSSG
jgi:hypothetical protein